jgi:hypothetical protein
MDEADPSEKEMGNAKLSRGEKSPRNRQFSLSAGAAKGNNMPLCYIPVAFRNADREPRMPQTLPGLRRPANRSP